MKSLSREERFLERVDQSKGIIHRISNSYCRNAEDRKDLVQEIVAQLWISFGRYDSRYRWSTWVYRIALNVAIASYRKEKRRRLSQSPSSDGITCVIKVEEPATPEADIACLYKFIDRLKRLDKALMLLYLDDHSYKEMADMLDITESNVATKINRLKAKLRHHFSAMRSE